MEVSDNGEARTRLLGERLRLTEVLDALRKQGVPETRYRARSLLRRSVDEGGQDRISSPTERIESAIGDVEDALKKIEGGTYGVCEECGGAIVHERLVALPAARTCHPEHHSAPVAAPASQTAKVARAPDDQREFAKLSAWRADVASDLHWRPYIVCNDRVLDLLIQRRPKNRDELRRIAGLSRQVIDLHGDALLEMLSQRSRS